MGKKKKFKPWLNHCYLPTEDFERLNNLLRLDISLVYPSYYSLSLNIPVSIPRPKVKRVRQRIRQKCVRDLLNDHAKVHEILTRNEQYILSPVKVIIAPPRKIYNPFVKQFVHGSDYLFEIFKQDYFAYWFASLITYYRHYHINSYDLSWQKREYAEKNETYQKAKTHQEFKIIVNNRAKRQIIRAIEGDSTITKFGKIRLIRAVGHLAHNDPETLDFAQNALARLGFHGVIENQPIAIKNEFEDLDEKRVSTPKVRV